MIDVEEENKLQTDGLDERQKCFELQHRARMTLWENKEEKLLTLSKERQTRFQM